MRLTQRLGWPFIIAATLIVTCLLTLASMGRPGAPGFPVLHSRQGVAWVTWLVLTPGVLVLARRFPFGEGTPLRWLAAHLVLGAGFAFVAILISDGIGALLHGGRPGLDMGRAAPLVARLATGLLVYSLIAVSAQALSYHRTARAREAMTARLRADLAEARLASLEGRLHPHFLFNALNSIAALVRVDPPRAEEMVEQLSELLRAALRANPMQQVPLSEALYLAGQYLAIEQTRLGPRLRSSVEASPEAQRGLVPQLLLQPLVENAVRHGIAPLEAGGSIRVRAAVEGEQLRLTVEDDGVGFVEAAAGGRDGSGGLGLSAVRSALQHLYGPAQRFDVGAATPRGTVVRILLPYRQAAT
jgi:signal transduction histidine kinase